MAAMELDPHRYIASLESQLADAHVQLARANAFIGQMLEERKGERDQRDADSPDDQNNGGAFSQSLPDGIVNAES